MVRLNDIAGVKTKAFKRLGTRQEYSIKQTTKLPVIKDNKCKYKGVLHEKTRTGESFIPGWLFDFDRIYMMMGHFISPLLESALHVEKLLVRFKIANITHALPIPAHRQTDFTPKPVVVSLLHDTVAKFRTGVKFSLRYNNWGEITPGWVALAWHFVVISCKQFKYRAMRGNRSELALARKSPRCHDCKHPLSVTVLWTMISVDLTVQHNITQTE